MDVTPSIRNIMAFSEIEKLIEEEAIRLRQILSTMNRQDVAREIGLHPNTIYCFVKGSGVALDTLRRISEHIDKVRA